MYLRDMQNVCVCVCGKRFYTNVALVLYGKFEAHPTKIGQTIIHFPLQPFSPHFQTTHSAWIGDPLAPRFYSSHSACLAGLWATSQIKTNALVTQAGQRNCRVGASELQSVAKSALLHINHVIRSWWLHLFGETLNCREIHLQGLRSPLHGSDGDTWGPS